jgi:hypothetical protein
MYTWHSQLPEVNSDVSNKILSVAVFLVPDWGMNPAMASGCRTGLTSHMSWRLIPISRRHRRFHPPCQGLRIGPLDSEAFQYRNPRSLTLPYFPPLTQTE